VGAVLSLFPLWITCRACAQSLRTLPPRSCSPGREAQDGNNRGFPRCEPDDEAAGRKSISQSRRGNHDCVGSRHPDLPRKGSGCNAYESKHAAVALLVFGASAWPVDDHEGAPFLALDLPILLACAFVTGPFAAGAIALIASVSRQELRGRMSLSRCIYNHSQVALSVIAAGLVYHSVGGDPTDWPRTAIAAELALAADTGVNYLAVALIYSVGPGTRLRSVLQTLHVGAPGYFAAFYAGLGLSAAVMASLYIDAGTIAIGAARRRGPRARGPEPVGKGVDGSARSRGTP
jgi:hypothetical protein